MFKKLSIGILLIALLVLASIFFINTYTGSEDLIIRDKVLSYNPELINSLIITDYKTGEKIKIVQEEGVWNIYSEGKVYGADPDAINNAIALLNQLKIDTIAATKSGKWADYKVDEKEAIHILLYQDDNLVRVSHAQSFEENALFSEELFDIEYLKIDYPRAPLIPISPEAAEEPSEVQKTIEDFKRIYE